MADKIYNVLFVCTGNSARSILAESLLNGMAAHRFTAWSAGSQPKGEVHPLALQVLEHLNLPHEGLRSKSWNEFAGPDAPPLDFVFTVCDNAAGEVCPYWPGKPATAHWGYADPSAGDGSDEQKAEAFKHTLHAIRRRLDLLVNLPDDKLETMVLQQTAKDLATA